jgi:FHA domain
MLLGHVASVVGADQVVLPCRGGKDQAGSVLASLLLAADLASWDLSEVEQRNLLTVFVQQRRSQGRRVLLSVDDAHTFKPSAWEEIERLAAYRVQRQPAFEILLSSSESFAQALDVTRLGLAAKDVRTHRLTAPTLAELTSYLDWRLRRFDLGDLVTPVASQMIARLSGGRYGAVDVLAQMSLLLLRQLALERVDARVVRQAVATLVARQGAKLEPETVDGEHRLDVPPQGYLLISRAGKLVTRVTLGQRTLIGRSEHNDVCLPSPYLSRHHAVIVGTPQGYYVMDLNSVNGLLLNSRPVERAVLCDQDLLTVGPFRLKVQIPEWLAHGNPFPEAQSLAETAVMPPQPSDAPPNVRRVK